MSTRVEPLELQIERTLRDIRKEQRTQFWVAATGLAFLSLLVFGDAFVGTFEDCAKVFLWGFTSDIGVNVLLNQAKAVKT
jgi:hypothetical protein